VVSVQHQEYQNTRQGGDYFNRLILNTPILAGVVLVKMWQFVNLGLILVNSGTRMLPVLII